MPKVDLKMSARGRRSAAGANKRIAFIDISRAVAALVVFYTHIDAHFLQDSYGKLAVPRTVESILTEPLGLEEFGYGQVAVCLFFLVSGFVVTPIALSMGAKKFGVNRFFRVYPLLAAIVLLSVLAFWLGWRPLTSPAEPELTVGAVLSNLTLVNFSVRPFGAFAGVAWTLAVEVLFYLLLVALLPLFQRWVWAAIAVGLEVVLLAILLRGPLGDGFDGLASLAAYLLIPIAGQVIWAGWHRKIPGWLCGCYLAIAWVMLVWASDADVDVYYALRPAPAAIAVLLFAVGLGIEFRLRNNKFWTAMSERSFSLYLVHGLVGLPVMYALNNVLPLPLTLLLGVLATGLAVQLTYVTIERPSHQLGRRLSGRDAVRKPRGRHARVAPPKAAAPRPSPVPRALPARRVPESHNGQLPVHRVPADPMADTALIPKVRRPRAADRAARSGRL